MSRADPDASWDELDDDGYGALSKRPLQILAFLIPLIAAYEIGLALFLRSGDGVVTNEAHRTILRAFAMVGVSDASGLHLGGLVIVLVLVIWHLLNRDSWRVSWRVGFLMAAESIALAIPLLILGPLVASFLTPAAAAGGASSWVDLSLPGRLSISIGAGLYEELLFRMIVIAVIHTLIVDALQASAWLGATIALVVSAAAFTWYHPLGLESDATRISWRRVAFFFLAGLYFGSIFLLRGFGIVVGVHALYDVITVSLE